MPFVERPVIYSDDRRGRPGDSIMCNETGRCYYSQDAAAQAMGLSQSKISEHLAGKIKHVKGFTFKRIRWGTD